jgi:hypothetical protein
MAKAVLHHHVATAAKIALIVIPILSVAGWAQTSAPNGNESDFRDWQPTRGEVSPEEHAAGIRQSPTQRNAEDRELQQLSRGLMSQEPSSPVPPRRPSDVGQR